MRLRGRRKAPGRPVTYGTTPAFLVQFGLDAVQDLPGLDELKGAGLIDGRIPAGFAIPLPSDDPGLREDEEALEPDMLDFHLSPPPGTRSRARPRLKMMATREEAVLADEIETLGMTRSRTFPPSPGPLLRGR